MKIGIKEKRPTGRSTHGWEESIVTDLINALPGNGSVNTVQHATIEQRGYATRF
jgi:hypothetical protein